MIEHNNRIKAKQYAEYITGYELRKYVAEKVRKYVGGDITVFDGAAGSGQLVEYLDFQMLYAVEVQKEACDALISNYKNSRVFNMSFFEFENDICADAVIMNPPFSLKLKSLSSGEQAAISQAYPWKMSGVVDDIFLLKSLDFTKRYGFYIMYPGIAYRKSEQKMRGLIGYRLCELNVIQNAFDDTTINVLFLVIDKYKTSREIHKEIYECKSQSILHSETENMVPPFYWTAPVIQKAPKEIDITELERDIECIKRKRRALEDRLDEFVAKEVRPMLYARNYVDSK